MVERMRFQIKASAIIEIHLLTLRSAEEFYHPGEAPSRAADPQTVLRASDLNASIQVFLNYLKTPSQTQNSLERLYNIFDL